MRMYLTATVDVGRSDRTLNRAEREVKVFALNLLLLCKRSYMMFLVNQSFSSSSSTSAIHGSFSQDELGDEVSWAEDSPSFELSSTVATESLGQLSMAATQSLMLQQSVGLKSMLVFSC
jgi:hypothetical protein